MRTVLPNAEKSIKPVLPFGLLESSPKRHDATAAYSPPERVPRRISGFYVGCPTRRKPASTWQNARRRDRNGAFDSSNRVGAVLRQTHTFERRPGNSATLVRRDYQFQHGDICKLNLIFLHLAYGLRRVEVPLLPDNFPK
jgi:hypothetical protein